MFAFCSLPHRSPDHSPTAFFVFCQKYALTPVTRATPSRGGKWSNTLEFFYMVQSMLKRGVLIVITNSITNNVCDRCSRELTGKQKRWCSSRCSKLGLKSEYRRRHKERLNAYKNEWRKAKNEGNRPINTSLARRIRADQCARCESPHDLQLAHVKPIGVGGRHDVLITLCRKCHYHFDESLREFWYGSND